MAAADDKVKLLTSLIVIFEIYWVLASVYERDKAAIVAVLSGVLDFEFLVLKERELLRHALTLYGATNLDLEDSYNLTFAQKSQATDFKTFDKKLRRVLDSRSPFDSKNSNWRS